MFVCSLTVFLFLGNILFLKNKIELKPNVTEVSQFELLNLLGDELTSVEIDHVSFLSCPCSVFYLILVKQESW